MNIAIVTHSYLPDVGGSEQTVRGLAKEFTNQLHKAIIVVLTVKKYKPFEVVDGIEVYRLYVPFLILPGKGFKCLIDLVKLSFSLPKTLIELSKILKKNKIQIINVHYEGLNAFCLYILSFFLPLKFIITLQGFHDHVIPFLKGNRAFIVKIIYRLILKRASFITACSRDFLNSAIETAPELKTKSTVIHNGIDLREFDQNGSALINFPYILCLGRLDSPYKGFDLALLAFKDVLDSGFNINLVIAGDGPAMPIYREFKELLNLDGKVMFFGLVNRSETVNLFKNCLFFVMPSRIEPFGIVNLEAMAAGKAVVATKVGGVPEVIEDGVTGLLVKPCSDKALSEGIKRLLIDEDLRKTLGENARKKIEAGNFSWKNLSKEYLKIYQKILNNAN
ncbi:MAG: glycosyltransferase family 4 protein [Candidatus Omnitrophota bacterium]